jgi:hypothetical protein
MTAGQPRPNRRHPAAGTDDLDLDLLLLYARNRDRGPTRGTGHRLSLQISPGEATGQAPFDPHAPTQKRKHVMTLITRTRLVAAAGFVSVAALVSSAMTTSRPGLPGDGAALQPAWARRLSFVSGAGGGRSS